MGVYGRQIATARRLIRDKGQPVIWQQVRDTENESEPWKPSNTPPTEHTVDMVFLPETRTDREGQRSMGGMEVPTGNLIGLMGSVPFEPSIKDIIIRDGVPLGIQTIDALAPNGDIIYYTIRLKV